jgi:hypothetical protein
MISIAQETLGFRRTDFSSVFSLLIPAYSLPGGPAVLTVDLRSPWNAPLPILTARRQLESHSFGVVLEPRYIFGTGLLDQ